MAKGGARTGNGRGGLLLSCGARTDAALGIVIGALFRALWLLVEDDDLPAPCPSVSSANSPPSRRVFSKRTRSWSGHTKKGMKTVREHVSSGTAVMMADEDWVGLEGGGLVILCGLTQTLDVIINQIVRLNSNGNFLVCLVD